MLSAAFLLAATLLTSNVDAQSIRALSSTGGVSPSLPASRNVTTNSTNTTASSSTGVRVVATPAATAAAPVCNFNFAAAAKDIIYAIANQQRLFAQHGLSLCFTAITNTGEAYNNLLAGQYDVLETPLDNTLDRYINAGNNITVIGGLDGNPQLSLYSVSGIQTPADLYGKVIAVDSAFAGYEYVVSKILLLYGVQPGSYGFLPVGDTATRLQALQNGNYTGNVVHATLIQSPFSEFESAALASNARNVNNTVPLNKLAAVSDYIPEYQGSVLTVNRPILSNSTKFALLTNFTLVQLQARQILQISANRDLVIKSIATEYNVTNTTAASLYESALNPDSGYLFNTNLQIFQSQLLTATYLRQQFGGFSGKTDLSSVLVQGSQGLVDYRVRDAALAALYQKNTYAAPLNASTAASTGVQSGGFAANDTTPATKMAYKTFY